MNRTIGAIFTLLILLIFSGCTVGTVPRAKALLEVPRITPEQLWEALRHRNATVLDVRDLAAYNHSKYKIKGAFYADPQRTGTWAPHYPKDVPLVLY